MPAYANTAKHNKCESDTQHIIQNSDVGGDTVVTSRVTLPGSSGSVCDPPKAKRPLPYASYISYKRHTFSRNSNMVLDQSKVALQALFKSYSVRCSARQCRLLQGGKNIMNSSDVDELVRELVGDVNAYQWAGTGIRSVDQRAGDIQAKGRTNMRN